MNLLKKISITLLILVLSSHLNQIQARVAVIDMPANIDHPLLKDAIDWDFMAKNQLELPDGNKISLLELNRKCYSQMMKDNAVNYKKYEKGRNFALIQNYASEVESLQTKEITFFSFMTNLLSMNYLPKFNHDKKRLSGAVFAYSASSHGTTTTDIAALASEGKAKIVPLPLLCNFGKSTEKNLKQQLSPYDLVDKYTKLLTGQVLAINYSLGSNLKDVVKSQIKRLGLLSRPFVSRKIKNQIKMEWEKLHLTLEIMVNLMPETIFVFSAGNDSDNLDETVKDLAEITHKNNVLFVGAVSSATINDILASYSNYSSAQVKIAACGQVTSAMHEGGTYSVAGTSFSAPMVVGRIANFASKQEQSASPRKLGSELLKDFLNSSEFHYFPALEQYIEKGRVLKFCKNR